MLIHLGFDRPITSKQSLHKVRQRDNRSAAVRFRRAVGPLALLGFGILLISAAEAESRRYSIGNPSNEEQVYIELINRLRSDPAGEAGRLATTTNPDILQSFRQFGVDVGAMKRALEGMKPAPPLAPNAKLSAAARRHSDDMLETGFQGHVSSDGYGLGKRVSNQDYKWRRLNENVYAYSESVDHGHAGFTVNWGRGPRGMQAPPIHRESLLDPDFNELGVGHVIGSKGVFGPELVTQILATTPESKTFITGVAFYDLNGNDQYDSGEGIGSARVSVSNCRYNAVTADAGGYAIPVPGNGSYDVTLRLPGRPDVVRTVSVRDDQNVKVDFTPPYETVAISGPRRANRVIDNTYDIVPLAAAKSYDLKVSRLVDSRPSTERVHLTFRGWEDQSFAFENPVLATADSELRFSNQFRWVKAASKLYAQVSLDEGYSWETVWSRPGTNGRGDSQFKSVAVPLAGYANKVIKVRMLFRHHGNAFLEPQANLGVLVESVHVTASHEVVESNVFELPGNADRFTIDPPAGNLYLVQVRPRLPAPLPYGEGILVFADIIKGRPPNSVDQQRLGLSPLLLRDVATTALRVGDFETFPDGQMSIDFTTTGSFADMWVEKSFSLQGPWSEVDEAQLINFGNGFYRFETSGDLSDRQLFFRVRGMGE